MKKNEHLSDVSEIKHGLKESLLDKQIKALKKNYAEMKKNLEIEEEKAIAMCKKHGIEMGIDKVYDF